MSMAGVPSGGRAVDPAAEVNRLTAERAHGPAKVLHAGDVVRVYDAAGDVFTGRVAGVERHAVPHPDRLKFRVVCEPLKEGGSG